MVSRRVESVAERRRKRLAEEKAASTAFFDEKVPSWNCKKCGLTAISKTISVCPECDEPKK